MAAREARAEAMALREVELRQLAEEMRRAQEIEDAETEKQLEMIRVRTLLKTTEGFLKFTN